MGKSDHEGKVSAALKELRKDTRGWDAELLKLGEDAYREVLCRAKHDVFPIEPSAVFKAFELTPHKNVRVVILGQDPYYKDEKQAHGLAFSVPPGVAPPPSLYKIYAELGRNADKHPADVLFDRPNPIHGCLERWAKEEGVLLLNTALTVEKGIPGGHADEWTKFTDKVIELLAKKDDGLVFMLWGIGHAVPYKEKIESISECHKILTSTHPAAGGRIMTCIDRFKDCYHFWKANNIFKERGQKGIDWQLTK